MIRKSVVILLTFVCVFMFAGCNDSEKSNGSDNKKAEETGLAAEDPGDSGDFAQLLSKAEAEELLGEPIKEPEATDTNNPLGQITCMYTVESEDSLKFIQLSLVNEQLVSEKLKEQDFKVKDLYDDTKEMLGDVQIIEGIGDEAFWGTNGLHILKGNYYLNIMVGFSNDSEKLSLAQKVAEIAVERLK